MKGFIAKAVAGVALGAGLSALVGCNHTYRDVVDTCWPERYNAMARSSVREAFFNQAANGHVLDQTVWDYMFARDAKTGLPTDQLHPAGIDHMTYLSRRRPADLHLFLQTAQDIPYTPGEQPDRVIQARAELDQKRVQAIQAFLVTQLAPRGCTTPVQVTIHDPAPVGIQATPITGNLAPGRELPVIGGYQKLQQNFQGILPTEGGGGGQSAASSSTSSSGASGGASGSAGQSSGGSGGGR